MKLPLLAPMSQAMSPGRSCRQMAANSALESRSKAFSARARNRMLSVVNQAWKIDMGSEFRFRAGGPPSPFGLRRGSLRLLRYEKAGLACPAVACEASEGWWGKKDSNLRSHKTADLQSPREAGQAQTKRGTTCV